MFFLNLEIVEFQLSGFSALDLSRRLGLADSTSLSNARGHSSTAQCQVEESFARLWFGDLQTEGTAEVPIDLLSAGDVRYACDGYAIAFADDLDPARIKELYVAVRFRACREQVSRLQARLDEFATSIQMDVPSRATI